MCINYSQLSENKKNTNRGYRSHIIENFSMQCFTGTNHMLVSALV
jgi:hypothetical protein